MRTSKTDSEQKLVTRASIEADLKAIGVGPGMTLIVHSSLRSLGWVCGGPVTVVAALQSVLTSDGTLVMPTHSCDYTDPSHWKNPPVPQNWWEKIRETMPAFEPDITPSSYMGKIPETFRSFEAVKRSLHPSVSFAAWGKNAAFITDTHELDFSLGEKSPLARIYDLDGSILLIGVGHEVNTSLHLAEARQPDIPTRDEGGPLVRNGSRQWLTYRDLDYDDSDFVAIGSEFAKLGRFSTGKIGAAEAALLKQRPLVEFATDWMKINR